MYISYKNEIPVRIIDEQEIPKIAIHKWMCGSTDYWLYFSYHSNKGGRKDRGRLLVMMNPNAYSPFVITISRQICRHPHKTE